MVGIKALHPCRKFGCGGVTAMKYCEDHQDLEAADNAKTAEAQKRYDKERGKTAKRGYDARWNRFSQIYKRKHPLCKDCQDEGVYVPTDVPHHVISLEERPDLKYAESNLMPLCNMHHNRRHGRGR